MDKILGFLDEYRYLSNFYDTPVEFEGLQFASTEAAYQAAKTLDRTARLSFCTAECQNANGRLATKTPTPGQTKRMGQRLALRADWEVVKFQVMHDIVKDKFTRSPYLGEKLLATGDAYLEETNTWGDKTWGVCNGEGQNHLGKILMKVREELRTK
jgi:N-glycosidase YbiA